MTSEDLLLDIVTGTNRSQFLFWILPTLSRKSLAHSFPRTVSFCVQALNLPRPGRLNRTSGTSIREPSNFCQLQYRRTSTLEATLLFNAMGILATGMIGIPSINGHTPSVKWIRTKPKQ